MQSISIVLNALISREQYRLQRASKVANIHTIHCMGCLMSSYATNPLHQFPLEMECKWLRRKRERKEREREGEWNLWGAEVCTTGFRVDRWPLPFLVS